MAATKSTITYVSSQLMNREEIRGGLTSAKTVVSGVMAHNWCSLTLPLREKLERIYNYLDEQHLQVRSDFDARWDAQSVRQQAHDKLSRTLDYLHGKRQVELYAKYKHSSPEVRAHWHAAAILKKADRKLSAEIKRYEKRDIAKSAQDDARHERRKDTEIRLAIDILLRYAGIKTL